MRESPYAIVLFGATGFTGVQAAQLLAQRGVNLAVAGRNPAKLEALRVSLGPVGERVGVIVADASAPESITAMVRQAGVVLNMAGPYARYGDPVVDAAVAAGVDYADITGETWWVRGLIDRHHERARQSGVRIVPMCGFDSVPSDLGAWMMVRALAAQGLATREVRGAFKGRGGLNGGTVASLMGGLDHLDALRDPVLLNPPEARGLALAPDETRARFDEALGIWVSPFVMSVVNSRVVRRSAALCAQRGLAYGPAFDYREGWDCGRDGRLSAMVGALGSQMMNLSGRLPGLRALVGRFAPQPGEGPSEAVRDSGFFRLRLVAVAEDGSFHYGEVRDQGDPGNRCTVKMACESAILLSETRGEGQPGGLLTPATAGGDALVARLRDAGMVLEQTAPPGSTAI